MLSSLRSNLDSFEVFIHENVLIFLKSALIGEINAYMIDRS